MTNNQAMNQINESSNNRQIRVFISSTFRDMQAERDELTFYVFPELRRRCRERYVEFDSVDLRWGITEEQSMQGEVLPICLAMIERCHPYFLCLLGDRYGWVPNHIDDTLIAKHSWLRSNMGKSVTELEIIYGSMKNPSMKNLSYFYFRDTEASLKVEEFLKKGENYSPDSDNSLLKLSLLKERIRKSGIHLKENYPDPKTLGQWILNDLWESIDKRFPKNMIPSYLERERLNHEAYAEMRRKVYVNGEKYFKQLDDYCESDRPPLLILGESGSGKSALLSNWTMQYRKHNPNTFLLCHYIGSTVDSANHITILRRIMKEIKDRYEPGSKGSTENRPSITDSYSEVYDTLDVPDKPHEVIAAFPHWLAKAAEKGKFILIIDALNQLEEKDGSFDLGWLPSFIPKNVRLILSALPGNILDELKRRNWSVMKILPMKKSEQKEYIDKYLDSFGKKLNRSQTAMIINNPQSSNPLYLRTLLEELKVFGEYELLNDRIRYYLEAPTIHELIILILERLEDTYEKERKGLVGDSLTLLWASRRGLSQTELLEMLGSEGKPVPQAYWSPLFLAIEEFLINRSGLISFFHDFMKIAIEERYIKTEAAQKEVHIHIANYFEQHEHIQRKVDELPWQLRKALEWERLKDCLTSFKIFWEFRTDLKKMNSCLTGSNLEKCSILVVYITICLHVLRRLILKQSF